MYAYVVHFTKRFSRNPEIVRNCLKLFNWSATTDARIIELSREGAVVPVILRVMRKHEGNGGVLGPGILFLTRAAGCYPPALATMLRMKVCVYIVCVVPPLSHSLLTNQPLQPNIE